MFRWLRKVVLVVVGVLHALAWLERGRRKAGRRNVRGRRVTRRELRRLVGVIVDRNLGEVGDVLDATLILRHAEGLLRSSGTARGRDGGGSL
jgi:hypothetical protein